ncbi:hypothetical protein H1P_1510002 [Hyella patelloides LEGE 07179]|uniref:HNH nuclease domain-containing protein n=1 Tax=Hyella patelloides LEGE 07179 TaxID=945734 RepID=A0A563VM68_9CYAN|nr:HNH endonuclease signature motif containing protein [Hyella patelloides]VEP12511.1 hypothetical protein H1P_1510002 [Hyella patelloides LEGE 07179]
MQINFLEYQKGNKKSQPITEVERFKYASLLEQLDLTNETVIFITRRGKPLIVDVQYSDEIKYLPWNHSSDDFVRCAIPNEVGELLPQTLKSNSHCYLHHLIWYLHHKVPPKAELAHINKIPWDNRIANLREVSQEYHLLSRRESSQQNDTKACSIQWDALLNKWAVRDGDLDIGVFDSRLEAAKALVNYLEKL